MKKSITLVLVAGLLTASRCAPPAKADDPDSTPDPTMMDCRNIEGTNVPANLYRCENIEAVCFATGTGGISCKFK